MKLLQPLLSILAAGFFAAAPVMAADPVYGSDYMPVASPQPTEANGKVEVLEFFWFGCPHCATLEPVLQAWVKKLPADVSFKKVPAVFNEKWEKGARLYYTLEAMGLLEKLSDQAFVDGGKLTSDPAILDWIAKRGVDRSKFLEMYNSFGVDNRVRQAEKLSRAYNLDGVPALIVGGKYRTAPSITGGNEKALRAADLLIAKNRTELGK